MASSKYPDSRSQKICVNIIKAPMYFNFKKSLGLLYFLLFILAPTEAESADKLLFEGTSSGKMYLSAPPVASGTVVLPSVPGGGDSYLLDGTRKVITKPPLKGGGALSGDLSLSLDLSDNYLWRGTQNYSQATSILPNSYGLPSTCLAGSVYVNLSSPTSKQLYLCESTNNWVEVGGGGNIDVSTQNNTLLTGSSLTKLSGTQIAYLGSSVSTTEADARMTVAADCIVKNISINISVTPGTNQSYSIALLKNGVSTNNSTAITAGSTSATINTSMQFLAGETLTLKITPNSTPPAAYMSFSAKADFS